MPTPTAVERILERLKDGLLINLDKHSVERTRQILLEEINPSVSAVGTVAITSSGGQEKTLPSPKISAAVKDAIDAHNKALNDVIAKQKAGKAEALAQTAAGAGMGIVAAKNPPASAGKPEETDHAKG